MKIAMPISSRRVPSSRAAYASADAHADPLAPAGERGAAGMRSRTSTRARNDSALSAKQAVAPKSASVTPPIAGPASRATLMPAALRLTACESRGAGTSAGIRASMAGSPSAKPTPTRNVRT